ncbi:MAG: nucleotidyltransferase domain-containing protein [Anaerolineae bacterium]
MINQHITIPFDEIAAFCERHHIRKLSLFGSVLRDDFRPDSDVDVLVEFEEGQTPGWNIVSMEQETGRYSGAFHRFSHFPGIEPPLPPAVVAGAYAIYERA